MGPQGLRIELGSNAREGVRAQNDDQLSGDAGRKITSVVLGKQDIAAAMETRRQVRGATDPARENGLAAHAIWVASPFALGDELKPRLSFRAQRVCELRSEKRPTRSDSSDGPKARRRVPPSRARVAPDEPGSGVRQRALGRTG